MVLGRLLDVDTQVRKAMADNLRSMSAKGLDDILAEGLTFRQRFQREKTQPAENPGTVPCGNLYYAKLRSMYAIAMVTIIISIPIILHLFSIMMSVMSFTIILMTTIRFYYF